MNDRAQKHHVAPPSDAATNVIEGDASTILEDWPESSADLVYLDPPFNTGRAQTGRAGTYADRWDSAEAYRNALRPVLAQAHRLLKPTGSILLHCDWRTCHYSRLELDGIFGEENFVNHLIWAYGLGGSSPRRFARKHDDILFYGRSTSYYFDPPMVPATSARMRGELKKATDVLQIPAINNMARERTGYPTQKPLALLELLIRACCPAGGRVVDPFCGSGTTLVAARALGRRAVGIDRNPEAVRIARERLERLEQVGRGADSAPAEVGAGSSAVGPD
ncbi:MAG: site-specific DNA-methyltransferase [Phycisphaerales bacterium]|nr:MAG: site-specific DNA-methyltransferase [Phycisphaerales bacterium]